MLILALCLVLVAGPSLGNEAARQAVLEALPQAAWVTQGDGARVMYIFTDMNCPYCADLYRTLTPMLAERKLQLRWVPVAVVATTSEGKAAAVLQADDPLAALDYNKMNYKRGTGGAIAEDIPMPEVETALRNNERLLAQAAVPVVPTMLFKTRDGEAVVFQGSLSPIALGRIFDRLH